MIWHPMIRYLEVPGYQVYRIQTVGMGTPNVKAATVVFHDCDTGGKGFLTRHELRAAHIQLFGWHISAFDLDALQPKACPAAFELSDFCAYAVPKLLSQDPHDSVRRHFSALDPYCNGYITLDDLRNAAGEVAPHIPAATVRLLFCQVDSDGDGRVSFADFASLMEAARREAPASTRPGGEHCASSRVGASPKSTLPH